MTVATVSSKGWVVIPGEYRKKHHIEPGKKVESLVHVLWIKER